MIAEGKAFITGMGLKIILLVFDTKVLTVSFLLQCGPALKPDPQKKEKNQIRLRSIMKNRKISKTYVIAAVALSVTLLIAGCGPDTGQSQDGYDSTEEEIQNKDSENKNDVIDNQETSSGDTDVYNHILAEYKDMVQNDFYIDLLDHGDLDAYDSSFGEDIGAEIRNHKQKVYYAFYDIDGNGTEELIIAGCEDDASGSGLSLRNYDLYTFDGSNVVHIFPEMEFGYRTNVSLYANGIIKVCYSGSAGESGVDFYRLDADGLSHKLVDSFASAGSQEGDTAMFTYSQNGTEITEEEYNTKIQSYETALTTALDWIQIQ